MGTEHEELQETARLGRDEVDAQVLKEAVLLDASGSVVVDGGALLARLDAIGTWKDLREVREVLRVLVAASPRLDSTGQARGRRQSDHERARQSRSARTCLERWDVAINPDTKPDLDPDSRSVLQFERRRMRIDQVGRWDRLRIVHTGRMWELQGHVNGDDDVWTCMSGIHTEDSPDEAISARRALLTHANEAGYDSSMVEVEAG